MRIPSNLTRRDLKQCMDTSYRDRGMEPALVKSLLYQLLSGIDACHVVSTLRTSARYHLLQLSYSANW